MGNQLPIAFVDQMKRLLGDEFDAFMASYDAPRYYGLRVNTLKMEAERFATASPFRLKPIPWVREGYYYEETERPGKHPYYHAGLYYIQEPSAMSPVELLDVQPGDWVLDLCAAPGGKSTQIAAKLRQQGLLVTNDNHADRVKALAKNIELAGIRNAVILNEEPRSIAQVFVHAFDKILIDAPCSGEGMFRKDEDMARQWERHTVEKCSIMQRDILKHAARLLAPGGTIVYSTCTFSPEENEAMIAEFLDRHPQFTIVPVPSGRGFRPGRPDWISGEAWRGQRFSATAVEAVRGAGRLWPHHVEGEGHFMAVLRHHGELASPEEIAADQPRPIIASRGQSMAAGTAPAASRSGNRTAKGGAASQGRGGGKSKPSSSGDELEAYEQFAAEHLLFAPHDSGKLIVYGQQLYLSPADVPPLDGLKVVRPGWHLGTLKKNRFEPSQALAMGLRVDEVRRKFNLTSGDSDAIRYLKGETVAYEAERVERTSDAVNVKGYGLVCIDGFPVGWGKWLDGMIKNEYPAGWRWT